MPSRQRHPKRRRRQPRQLPSRRLAASLLLLLLPLLVRDARGGGAATTTIRTTRRDEPSPSSLQHDHRPLGTKKDDADAEDRSPKRGSVRRNAVGGVAVHEDDDEDEKNKKTATAGGTTRLVVAEEFLPTTITPNDGGGGRVRRILEQAKKRRRRSNRNSNMMTTTTKRIKKKPGEAVGATKGQVRTANHSSRSGGGGKDDGFSSSSSSSSSSSPYDMSENRIVGGDFVSDSDAYPWFVQGNGCGGALIAPDVVLTAAHCVPAAFRKGDLVRVGSNRKDRGGQTSPVLRAKRHARYDPDTHDYDFALVQIEPVLQPGTPTVAYNEREGVPSAGESLTVMGYGGTKATDMYGNHYPDRLKDATIDALSDRACQAQFGITDVDSESMFCAGAPGKDSCFGDSGGPLVRTTGTGGTNAVVVGVVSWGPEYCAVPGLSGVYSRVSAGASWIRETMCALTTTDICDAKGTNAADAPAPAGGGVGTTGSGGGTSGNDNTAGGGAADPSGSAPASDGGGTGGTGTTDDGATTPTGADSAGIRFEVVVQYDAYSKETAWGIFQWSTNDFVAYKDFGQVRRGNQKKTFPVPLRPGESYTLLLEDTMGDGFCCDYGDPGYIQILAKDASTDETVWGVQASGRFGYQFLGDFHVPADL